MSWHKRMMNSWVARLALASLFMYVAGTALSVIAKEIKLGTHWAKNYFLAFPLSLLCAGCFGFVKKAIYLKLSEGKVFRAALLAYVGIFLIVISMWAFLGDIS